MSCREICIDHKAKKVSIRGYYVNGKTQFRNDLGPFTAGSGFLFTNSPVPASDDASITAHFTVPGR